MRISVGGDSMSKRGIMTDSPTIERWVAFAWLALFTVSLASLSLGVWSTGQDIVYRLDILMVCAPISAASLLVGTFSGLACGLTAGVALSIYGILQPTNPIDIYGSPLLVYVVTFTLFGLVSGSVVNRILRRRSHGKSHIARLALATLVCLVLILPVYAFISTYSVFSNIMSLADPSDVYAIVSEIVPLSSQLLALGKLNSHAVDDVFGPISFNFARSHTTLDRACTGSYERSLRYT